jgi:hypothetical protein
MYYLTILKSKERLEGMDLMTDSNPPHSPTHELYGPLRGPTVRARMLWVLDDLGIDRGNLPELPPPVCISQVDLTLSNIAYPEA